MPDFKIKIDNKYIEQVDTTKFLGILIDNNVTSHVTKIVPKYNGIVRKVCPFLNSESLHTLYNTLILPYLSYCTIVWGDQNNSNLNSLFITQKKIVRTCTNSLWLAHTTPLFISLKKLKFFDIYSYQLAIHMYRYHHDLLPPGLPNNHFPTQANIHDYNTRQANDLHVDPTNTKLAQNNIKGGCAHFTMCILHFQLIDLDLWNAFCEVSPWGNFLFTLQRQNKVCNPGDEAMM